LLTFHFNSIVIFLRTRPSLNVAFHSPEIQSLSIIHTQCVLVNGLAHNYILVSWNLIWEEDLLTSIR
jgi:hypothetical protein